MTTTPTTASMFHPDLGKRIGIYIEPGKGGPDGRDGYVWRRADTKERLAFGITEHAAWCELAFQYAARSNYLLLDGRSDCEWMTSGSDAAEDKLST